MFEISQSLIANLYSDSDKSLELLKKFYSRTEVVPPFDITPDQIERVENIINDNEHLLEDFYKRISSYIEQIHQYNIGQLKSEITRSK